MGVAETEFEPLILAFCCNWCSYAGADLAETAHISTHQLKKMGPNPFKPR